MGIMAIKTRRKVYEEELENECYLCAKLSGNKITCKPVSTTVSSITVNGATFMELSNEMCMTLIHSLLPKECKLYLNNHRYEKQIGTEAYKEMQEYYRILENEEKREGVRKQ